MHIESKHEGFKYACNQCNKQFKQHGYLKRHIESQHEGVKYAWDQSDYQAIIRQEFSKRMINIKLSW